MSRKLKLLALTVPAALAALIATPVASAASTTMRTATCPTVTPTTVFAPWGDYSPYVLAEGGSMEDPKMWKGATFTADNDSYELAGRGKRALRLVNGASATTAWVCQGWSYPTMRFMVRNVGSATARLDLYMSQAGSLLPLWIGTMTAGPSWAPSPIIFAPTALLPDGYTVSDMQLTFKASGTGADFRVDNLFIDPRSRG